MSPNYKACDFFESPVPFQVNNTTQCSKGRGVYYVYSIDKSQGYSSFCGYIIREGVVYEFASSSDEYCSEAWGIDDLIWGTFHGMYFDDQNRIISGDQVSEANPGFVYSQPDYEVANSWGKFRGAEYHVPLPNEAEGGWAYELAERNGLV